jgi:hypothetical protein
MISANVTLTNRRLPFELARIAAQLKNPVALYKDVGRRAANDLRKHYADRDATSSNRLGGRRTHFWLEVRDAVQQPVADAGGVSIVIGHPAIAAKVHGAVIRPQNAAALTIPLHQLAHGRRASVFEDETGHKLFRPKGKNVLMADIDGTVVPIYALVKRVNMRPDPEALPDDNDFANAILNTATKHLARMLARQTS